MLDRAFCNIGLLTSTHKLWHIFGVTKCHASSKSSQHFGLTKSLRVLQRSLLPCMKPLIFCYFIVCGSNFIDQNPSELSGEKKRARAEIHHES
jgi:hypothetical protein